MAVTGLVPVNGVMLFLKGIFGQFDGYDAKHIHDARS